MSAGFVMTIVQDQVLAGLSGLRDLGHDLTPVLHDIGNEGEESTRLRFDTNLAPDGTPWLPSLHAKVTGQPTLVMSGALRDSIHYQLDGDRAVEWGSNLIYAGVHQRGDTISAKGAGGLAFTLATNEFVLVQSVKLPKREYLGLSANDNAEILDIVGRHIAIAAAGGHG